MRYVRGACNGCSYRRRLSLRKGREIPVRASEDQTAVYPLGGAFLRPRPIVPIVVSGPQGFRSYDACLDIGTDDTLFPKALPALLGIPLSQPPNHGEAK